MGAPKAVPQFYTLTSCLHKPPLLYFLRQPTCSHINSKQIPPPSMRKIASFPLKQKLLLASVSNCSFLFPTESSPGLHALPPPKRTLIFGVKIWKGLFLRVGKGAWPAGGRSGMKGPRLELEDKAGQRLLRSHHVQHFPEHCSGIFSLVS